MTPSEAARVIGCTPGQVRHLIRIGTLRASRVRRPGGYCYDLHRPAVVRYRDRPQTHGFPRGAKRESERGTIL